MILLKQKKLKFIIKVYQKIYNINTFDGTKEQNSKLKLI